ncbi:MAG: M4 family metallopeptidase [Ignavibacteriales bacterium]|nr:M4 family metallopeptidase [Ignavibacteriales bacterium]
MTILRILFVTTILALIVLINFLSYSQNKPKNDFSGAKIVFDKDGLSPLEIRFMDGAAVTKSNFFEKYIAFFDLSNDYEFVQAQELIDQLGQTHYRFNQFYKGVEVLNAQLILHEKNGLIHFANGKTVHGIDMNSLPTITEQSALQSALNNVSAEIYKWEIPSNEIFLKNEQQDPNATFYPAGELILTSGSKEMNKNNLELGYRFDIYAEQPLSRNYVDVNAVTGEIINTVNRIYDADVPGSGTTLYNGNVNMIVDNFTGGYRLQESERGGGIQTKDMQNGINYNNAVDFVDPDGNFSDPENQIGVSVHWATEGTYDYYWNIFSRDSYNNTGGTLYSYVSYDVNYNNAFWDGSRMTYGDGDGFWFSPLVGIDIIGHELTHGVTQYSANLLYADEPGALNESFSDIFGTAVEFYLEESTADWLIAEDCYLQPPYTLRSMEEPNIAWQPDTYEGLYWINPGGPDYGGVHTNSGVQNFWFYLLSVGGSGTNDNGDAYSVTGIGIDNASQIAYRSLTVYLTQTSNFHNARAGSINAATDLFGIGSQQYQSVIDAWNAVGVYSVGASFTADISAGYPPLLVQFTDLSVSSPTPIISWEWDFNNDGITDATDQNPTWLFNDAGLFTVSLTVSDGINPNTLTKVDYIVPFNQGSILVWEGKQGGATYSGPFIRDYLLSRDKQVVYLTSGELPFPMADFDAVFLSFGNAYDVEPTFFLNSNAATVQEYLLNGGYLYLEGGDALGYDQVSNNILLSLFGIASSSDGLPVNKPVTNLTGIQGTITESMLFTSSTQPENYWIDTYVPNSTGQVAFNETTVGDVAIQNVGDLGQRTFCFSYALGKLNDENFPSTRENLLNQILTFFDITVPVELTSFTGSSADGNVILNWTTASEVNNQIFEIERRKENSDFTLIGFVEGRGTTTESQEYSYIDKNINSGKYFYRLKQIDFDGTFEYSNEIEVDAAPVSFSLEQNYPNPFNPSTKITYSIPHKSFVTIKVYDPLGSLVTELVQEEKEAGKYDLDFNASDLSSGVYFYRIEAGSFNKTNKMILMR